MRDHHKIIFDADDFTHMFVLLGLDKLLNIRMCIAIENAFLSSF